MATKITKLSDYTGNTLSVSPEQAIQYLQEFLEENPDFDKVFLVAINNKRGNFLYDWWKGQMLNTEAIVALHASLDDILKLLKGEEI
jgi:hypothetical protein